MGGLGRRGGRVVGSQGSARSGSGPGWYGPSEQGFGPNDVERPELTWLVTRHDDMTLYLPCHYLTDAA